MSCTKKFLGFLLAVLLAVTPIVAFAQQTDSAGTALREGRQLLKRGQADKALIQLRNALNLYTAFREARDHAHAEARAAIVPHVESGLLGERAAHALDTQPLAYGVKGARPVLDMIVEMVHEQGLSPRRVALEELFAPSTMDL